MQVTVQKMKTKIVNNRAEKCKKQKVNQSVSQSVSQSVRHSQLSVVASMALRRTFW